MNLLTTRRPIGNLFNLHNEMGRVFDGIFNQKDVDTDSENSTWMPTVDITETENSYKIQAELPGVYENDVNVSVTDHLLTIKGEKRQEEQSDENNIHRIERRYGSFQRSFTLPQLINASEIKAGFKDGILTLEIPKAEEARPTEIPIEVTSQ